MKERNIINRRRKCRKSRIRLFFRTMFSVFAVALVLTAGIKAVASGIFSGGLAGGTSGDYEAPSASPAEGISSDGAAYSDGSVLDELHINVDLNGLYSPCAILADANTGETLAEKNSSQKIYPASMTKIMTAILLAENVDDMDERVVMDSDIFQPLYAENASMAGFQPGEEATARDLLYGMLLPSGAECCAAIAQALDGSEVAFADRMNRRARDLGMENTHFVNATGLQDSDHRSTVRDLALLLDAALDNPTFREVFTAPRYSTSPTNLHPDGITVYSSALSLFQDADLGRMTLLGGKTGFTDEAGLCLATLAEADGAEYILVTAGAPGQSHTDTAHARDAAAVYQRLSDALDQ